VPPTSRRFAVPYVVDHVLSIFDKNVRWRDSSDERTLQHAIEICNKPVATSVPHHH
jgi:hypothetical protein